jgi:CheY-like chemotaxis protein
MYGFTGEISTHMKKILIVEDSVLIQKIVHDALETCFPCEVKAVDDGAKAYEELAKETYDLVITDIVMPVMDGLTLAEKIRVELASDVPIIMLTSLSVKNVRDSTSASGINAYLIKPIDVNQLIRIVKRLIPAESPPEEDETPLLVQNETSPPEKIETSLPEPNETSLTELDETSLPEIEEFSSKIDEDW